MRVGKKQGKMLPGQWDYGLRAGTTLPGQWDCGISVFGGISVSGHTDGLPQTVPGQ